MVSLNALRAFEAAGRHGRMVAAAEELYVTHGAVSRQIKQLEAILGVELFEGPKNRPVLTEAGRHMLPMLTSAFDQIDRAVREVTERARGVVTLSCPGTLMMRWLIPRLHAFNDAHPGIEVRTVAADRMSAANLASPDIAIRLMTRPVEAGETVNRAVLFDEVVGPVAAADFAEHHPVDTIEDLTKVRLLTSTARPESWNEWFDAMGVGQPAYETGAPFDRFYFMYEAVLGGLGVGLLPWQLAGEEIKSGRLVAPFGFRDFNRSHAVTWRQDAGQREEELVDWLLDEGAKMDLPEDM